MSLESKYRIVIINPYFGKMPHWFLYYLKTCAYNPSIDFLIFTDDDDFIEYAKENGNNSNIKVIPFSLSEVKKRIETILGFPVVLDRAYKLCDYKPAYGEIFSDYIEGYDFWGHSDVDLLWGNIRRFVTDVILDQYDRVYTRGPFSLYRNEKSVNAWYRTLKGKAGREDWKTVYTTDVNWAFDEWAAHYGGGMSYIIQDNNLAMYQKQDEADLKERIGYLAYDKDDQHYRDIYFKISKSGIRAYDLKTKREVDEVCFVHMQHRYPVCKCDASVEEYTLLPPNIIDEHIYYSRGASYSFEFKRRWLQGIRDYLGRIKQYVIK